MRAFSKRRQKVLTPFILALWLLAIVASVAHACGVGESMGDSNWTKAVRVGAHEGSDDGACPACEKFCADDFPVLTKIKAVQDPPAGQPLVAPAVVGERFQLAAVHVASPLPVWHPPSGIAVNTRFVRLAL